MPPARIARRARPGAGLRRGMARLVIKLDASKNLAKRPRF